MITESSQKGLLQMANRKKTPDILGAVLDKTSKPVQQNAIKTVNHNTIKSDNKVKATYYLSEKAVDALEDTQYQLRKMAGENRARVSKSFIVELAIQMALEDVEKNGNKSRILEAVSSAPGTK